MLLNVPSANLHFLLTKISYAKNVLINAYNARITQAAKPANRNSTTTKPLQNVNNAYYHANNV